MVEVAGATMVRRATGVTWLLALLGLLASAGFGHGQGSTTAPIQSTLEIRIGYVGRKPPALPAHVVHAIPADQGVAGARLAIADNETSGVLTGQSYTLAEAVLEEGQSAIEAARKLVEDGALFLVTSLAADELTALADELKETPPIIINAAATADRLRDSDCRANVFHVAPSRSMLTDGLAQYLAARKWRKIFLVVGPTPGDRLYVESLKRSAAKFGLRLTGERAWELGPLARARADGPTRAEALVFTRGLDADVIVVADEGHDFGDYLLFRTEDPKLIAGTQGLAAATWHQALDAWGAAQLHSRFLKSASRQMRSLDYQAWTAVRAIGEAATRAGSEAPGELEKSPAATVARLMASPDFEFAAYKGVPVSFRQWDRQLRQPILIVQPMALVSVSPQPGFLHQRTPLDTLGADQPESGCKAR